MPGQSTSSSHITIDGIDFRLTESLDEFLSSIDEKGRGVIRFQTNKYRGVLSGLRGRLKDRYGECSPQFSQCSHTQLFCAGCLWEFPPSHVVSLALPHLSGRIGGYTAPGYAEFGRSAACSQCGTDDALLVYEVFSPDQITAADVEAIREYWRQNANTWWSDEEQTEALCDLCNNQITHGRGYISGSNLMCEQCVGRAMADGLQSLRENPHCFGTALLRKVRGT